MTRNATGSRVPVFSLGERIRKARDDQGLSQQQLADLLDVDRKTVGNWETGRVHVRYGDLMLISSVTDVSLEWLAGELFRPLAGHAVGGDFDNAQGTRSDTHQFEPVAA